MTDEHPEVCLIGDADEYQRLADYYDRLNEGDLLGLAEHASDLTDTAQEVLRLELSKRRLKAPSHGKPNANEQLTGKSEPLGNFALLSSDDCIWQFPESEDALATGEMLAEAGIEYDLILPGNDRLDMRAPRIAVLPDDRDRVQEMLAKPIPEEFRVLVRTRDQFVVPTCSKCGSTKPVLQSIDPTNEWHCDTCGKTWTDSPATNRHTLVQTNTAMKKLTSASIRLYVL